MPVESTILLVDDSDDDVFLLLRAMKKANLANPVHVLKDGAQAREYLRGEGPYSDRSVYPVPSLILTDIKMPRMCGLELLQWIRMQPKLRRLRVVVMSHSRDSLDINRAYDLGANSYLVKPATLQMLVEIVEFVRRYWLLLCEKPDCQTD